MFVLLVSLRGILTIAVGFVGRKLNRQMGRRSTCRVPDERFQGRSSVIQLGGNERARIWAFGLLSLETIDMRYTNLYSGHMIPDHPWY